MDLESKLKDLESHQLQGAKFVRFRQLGPFNQKNEVQRVEKTLFFYISVLMFSRFCCDVLMIFDDFWCFLLMFWWLFLCLDVFVDVLMLFLCFCWCFDVFLLNLQILVAVLPLKKSGCPPGSWPWLAMPKIGWRQCSPLLEFFVTKLGQSKKKNVVWSKQKHVIYYTVVFFFQNVKSKQ